jgi:hypothetical protein
MMKMKMRRNFDMPNKTELKDKIKKIKNKIKKLIEQAHEDIDFEILLEYGLSEEDYNQYFKLEEKLMELQEKLINKK